MLVADREETARGVRLGTIKKGMTGYEIHGRRPAIAGNEGMDLVAALLCYLGVAAVAVEDGAAQGILR